MQPLPAKVGVIGDVHTEDELLDKALDALTAERAGVILCTGDLPDGRGSLERCVDLLSERGVLVVQGNHDRWLLANTMRDLPDATPHASVSPRVRAYLANLPVTREFSTPFGGLLLCHGLGTNDMGKVTPDDYGYALDVNTDLHALIRDPRFEFVVNGHSHRPMVRHFDGLTVINAGTLKSEHNAAFVLMDLGKGAVSFFGLDADRFVPRHIDALRRD